MMKNQDVYQKNPATSKLVNQGVANVNDDTSIHALSVLRYELETFVCDGQYEKGLSHILDTYLNNIEEAQQPAVWVSGFYGSGKSHLVKMLRALWSNTEFADGATARGIANLPQGIRDRLTELSNRGKRYGGLHAASGTLGSSANGSVRLALLSVIFKSAKLPESYPIARFVMWLRHEGIYDQIRSHVEGNGYNWEEELGNFYVAEGLCEALVQTKPNLFPTVESCTTTLNNLYPYVEDVSNDEMIKAIKQALNKNGKFPLTLVVLDEVQQYIGENSQRSVEVQEVVEACCKYIGGRLLFVGTGQTAVTSTSNLKKLEGRFNVRVELSDTDVNSVIRKVLLAKKPEAISHIEQMMQSNLGEISRHLAGTTIGHRQDDIPCFSQDYPILPVRRRFWENALRILDRTGTDSQLRNQLSMVHKVIQTNLNEPLGHVVPADHLYFDSADKLLQTSILPRKLHEATMTWYNGSEDERLMARACGLVFLVNKIKDQNREIGIHPTVDTLADLLLENLLQGSGNLRSKLPDLLDRCPLLMKVDDEYRIQTEESTAWYDEFSSQKASLSNDVHHIEVERENRIQSHFKNNVGKLSRFQGNSKVTRDIPVVFDTEFPQDADQRVCVWVRNGWTVSEDSVRIDARQAGNQSPTIFVFLPRQSADAIRYSLIEYKAACSTLDMRGIPNTPEGNEARAAMETTKSNADTRICELLDSIFSDARVFQGGGNAVPGNYLRDMLLDAADKALQRLYPQFSTADHAGWAKVYERAQKGAPDALKAVGDDGEAAKNPVCKEILSFIAGGKKGADIRAHFESAPYGWSGDAVDGGLQVLLVAGLVSAQDERRQVTAPTELARKAIGKAWFKVESATVTTSQRIQIRKLLQKACFEVSPGKESLCVPKFLDRLKALADNAGGEAPKPVHPDTSILEDIRLVSGNEQLLALWSRRDELSARIDDWNEQGQRISGRWHNWVKLTKLMEHAASLPDATTFQSMREAIEQQRLLLMEPDPVAPMLNKLTQQLRDELNRIDSEYSACHKDGMERLSKDTNWQQLNPEQRYQLLAEQALHDAARPRVKVATVDDVLETLRCCNLPAFADRVAAMPARFDKVVHEAAALCEPKTQFVDIPRNMLKTPEEIDTWLDRVGKLLKTALNDGPVMIR